MLVLTRRTNESVHIGDDIVVTVLAVSGDQVRIGIDAPRDLRVLRDEVLQAVESANREAASPSDEALKDLAQTKRPADERPAE